MSSVWIVIHCRSKLLVSWEYKTNKTGIWKVGKKLASFNIDRRLHKDRNYQINCICSCLSVFALIETVLRNHKPPCRPIKISLMQTKPHTFLNCLSVNGSRFLFRPLNYFLTGNALTWSCLAGVFEFRISTPATLWARLP